MNDYQKSHIHTWDKGGGRRIDFQNKLVKQEKETLVTSADTATASNQSSQFNARRRGLNRVSKFDTTASFTPAFLIALNTFSASGSQRCHACGSYRAKDIKKQPTKSFSTFLLKFGNYEELTFSVI